ncbi:unnamed protein product [Litomosoides sigmodontis]|uniref:PDZ domain-containing protein n=1 Tax=Litomosoides sigmodontis TaxID=42156 RepID=A0A3P6U6M0_LITSI|nr:unnamed protein product [Litomosoides sigmodontis]
MKDVYLEALGQKIPADYCQHFQEIINGRKGDDIGIRITKAVVVTKVERGSRAENLLQFGDIITSIDGKKIETRKEFEELLANFSGNDYSFKIAGIRLATKLKMDECRFPKGYEQNASYKYHIAVMYFIRGCKLALSVKSYNNKVYVTRVIEHTLSGMSLAKGDAILDVDSIPVTTITDTSSILCAGLRKKGYATLVIEQPNNPMATAYVRLALMTEKSIDIDLPLAPDVIDICQHECNRMKRNPNLKPQRSILKSCNDKTRTTTLRIQVSERTEDIPIACEDNPALLIKVPVTCAPGKQQYFTLSDSPKQ